MPVEKIVEAEKQVVVDKFVEVPVEKFVVQDKVLVALVLPARGLTEDSLGHDCLLLIRRF